MLSLLLSLLVLLAQVTHLATGTLQHSSSNAWHAVVVSTSSFAGTRKVASNSKSSVLLCCITERRTQNSAAVSYGHANFSTIQHCLHICLTACTSAARTAPYQLRRQLYSGFFRKLPELQLTIIMRPWLLTMPASLVVSSSTAAGRWWFFVSGMLAHSAPILAC